MECIDGFSDPNKAAPSRSDLQKLMPEQAPMQVVTEGFAPKPGYKGMGRDDMRVITVPFHGMEWRESVDGNLMPEDFMRKTNKIDWPKVLNRVSLAFFAILLLILIVVGKECF